MGNVFESVSAPLDPGQILEDPKLVSVVECDTIPGAVVAEVETGGSKPSRYLVMGEHGHDRYRVAQVWPLAKRSHTVVGSGTYEVVAQRTTELTGAVGMLVTLYYAEGGKPTDVS